MCRCAWRSRVKEPTTNRGTKSEYTVPPFLISHFNHWLHSIFCCVLLWLWRVLRLMCNIMPTYSVGEMSYLPALGRQNVQGEMSGGNMSGGICPGGNVRFPVCGCVRVNISTQTTMKSLYHCQYLSISMTEYGSTNLHLRRCTILLLYICCNRAASSWTPNNRHAPCLWSET